MSSLRADRHDATHCDVVSDVLCIWCLEERAPRKGREHVVGKAIGGSFTIQRVCGSCDNRLGNKADDPLAAHFGMLAKREALGLKGQRGTIPDVIQSILSNVGTAANDPTFRIDIAASAANATFDARVRPHVDIDVKIDGAEVRVAVNALRVDARDPELTQALFKGALRKKGVKDDRMVEALWQAISVEVREVSEQRTIEIPFQYRTNGHRAGLVKIAYELAWHWLGDTWLNDSIAAEMRRVALAGEDGSPLLTGAIRNAEEILASGLRVRDGHRRIVGALMPCSSGYVVMLRLLDELEASIVVTDDASAYRHPDKDAIVMDAVDHTYIETNFLALFGAGGNRSAQTTLGDPTE